MERSEKELINAINHYKQSLLKYSSRDNKNESKVRYSDFFSFFFVYFLIDLFCSYCITFKSFATTQLEWNI